MSLQVVTGTRIRHEEQGEIESGEVGVTGIICVAQVYQCRFSGNDSNAVLFFSCVCTVFIV